MLDTVKWIQSHEKVPPALSKIICHCRLHVKLFDNIGSENLNKTNFIYKQDTVDLLVTDPPYANSSFLQAPNLRLSCRPKVQKIPSILIIGI